MDDVQSSVLSSIRAKYSGPLEITSSTAIASLELDSLSLIEIIFELEERFDVELPFSATDMALNGQATIGSMIGAVMRGRAASKQ